MSRYQRLLSPTWVLQLTNAELIDTFGEAYEARETRMDAPDLIRRLDVLLAEISRREREGILIDDDWIATAP
jgi:hypothetical protein